MDNQNRYAEIVLFEDETSDGDSVEVAGKRVKEATFGFECTGGTATITVKGRIGDTWFDIDSKDMTAGTTYSFPFAVGAFNRFKATISSISDATIQGIAGVHTK